MDIVIDISRLESFLDLPPEEMFWTFFINFGWILLAFAFVRGVLEIYLSYIRNKWAATNKTIMLAIDIPRGNEQSPKAVENLFNYLGGAQGSISFFEKWFEGKFQKSFSFEIVSIEGYIQFLIQTPIEHRYLVETAVYSQYPDAEITEVDDYTKDLPALLPDRDYDVWGTEFIQSSLPALPIKCYLEFEHQFGPKETHFKDPMTLLMDLCSSLHAGEQLWFQIIIVPIGFDWVKASARESNKILNRKEKAASSGLFSSLLSNIHSFISIALPIWIVPTTPEKEEKAKLMTELSPSEKRRIEAIEDKASKLAFEAKIRVVYVARREVMNKAKVAAGMVGYMKQFTALDLNSFKPDIKKTFTKAAYFFVPSRILKKQKDIYESYLGRSDSRGADPGLYSVEELATIWHFPIEATVKGAMIQKAPGRRADAPASLPLAEEEVLPLPDIFRSLPEKRYTSLKEEKPALVDLKEIEEKEPLPPDNLPYVE